MHWLLCCLERVGEIILQLCSKAQWLMMSKSMLNTFPANLKKPYMFVQLATKCIDYCVVWSGRVRSYYNCVAKPNDSWCRNQCLNTLPASNKQTRYVYAICNKMHWFLGCLKQGGGSYYNCVAKPNDSWCRNQYLNTFRHRGARGGEGVPAGKPGETVHQGILQLCGTA